MCELFPDDGMRCNPADPYFPFRPRGFEGFIIRRWRRRVTEAHMAAEGIYG